MKKRILLVSLLIIFSAVTTYAQFGMRRGYGRPMGQRRSPQKRAPQQIYKPTIELSVGYGFPNEDKLLLPDFSNAYKGTVSQSGPITGSLDYRFSQGMSIGIMATHGKVSVPYYDDFGPITPVPALSGTLENTAILLNLVRYMPGSGKISPYLRTAIGINIWTQNFSDAQGNKVDPGQLPDFAYQVGLGAKINMSKNSSIFLEAGYGKYILHGGLSFKL